MMAVYDPDDYPPEKPEYDGPSRWFGVVGSIIFLLAAGFIIWLLSL